MEAMPKTWRTAVILIAVGLVLALPLSLYPGSNVICRVAQTFQVVDAGTWNIDPWKDQTNDEAVLNGHYYSDKAPGTSLIGIPVYAIYKAIMLGPGGKIDYTLARYVIRLLTLLPLCLAAAALCMVYLARIKTSPLAFAPAWLLGTVAFPFSVMLFGHQYAACLLVIAFVALHALKSDPNRPGAWAFTVVAGLACALAIVTEYPAALIALPLGLYYLALEKRLVRILVFGLAGAVLPAVVLLGYNFAIFGDPLHIGYQGVTDDYYVQAMSRGFIGVAMPTWEALWEITFSPAGGLFFTAPWLLFALPGLVLMLGTRGQRAEFLLFSGITAIYLAFNAGYWEPGGAMSFGPRHLIPCVPFVALAAFRGGLGLGVRTRAVFYATVAFSMVLTAFGTFADPTMPDRMKNPLYEFALPILAQGEGLESPWGMQGVTLFALFAGVMAIAVVLVRSRSKDDSKPQPHAARWTVGTVTVLALVYLLVLPYAASTEPGIRHQTFGNYYMSKNLYAQAEKSYHRAALSRRDPYIHYYRGRALAKLGRVEEMKHEFEKALTMDAEFPFKSILTGILEQLEHDE